MSAASVLRLVVLAAIWGASFLFMRLGVPELGPAWLMFGRVFMAAVFLALVALALKQRLPLKQYAGHYLLLSFFNTALPFLLLFLIPVFGVLWGHVFLDEAIGWHTLFGAAIVIAGTMLVTGFRITALFTPAKETQ